MHVELERITDMFNCKHQMCQLKIKKTLFIQSHQRKINVITHRSSYPSYVFNNCCSPLKERKKLVKNYFLGPLKLTQVLSTLRINLAGLLHLECWNSNLRRCAYATHCGQRNSIQLRQGLVLFCVKYQLVYSFTRVSERVVSRSTNELTTELQAGLDAMQIPALYMTM